MQSGEPHWISDLFDLTGMGMAQIEGVPESDLLHSLRRILAETGTLTEQYAAFDNQITYRAESNDSSGDGDV